MKPELLDEQKVNELYTEYKQKVYSIALSYVKDNYVAEDLTHEILIKCYLAHKTFNGKCSFHTWMYRIATNHCIDYLRKGYRKRDVLHEDIELFMDKEEFTPESEVLDRCDQEEVLDKLKLLPSKYQEVLRLYYFKNQSLKEIEQHLNINLSTIKTRMLRAKKMLKEMYMNVEGPEIIG
ncbi:sigma-70 family RNA polymerase sigma factor [Bacillus luteolus]|uniref:Sigma-70 family RNA polymerase sigma factor n=1 Tax=Litchfieldia luteola TaxID=682179 RepID=A0ABR9QDD8_9BACI|nr:sigma-70 family RNA polymerase sigma factor [Cytobacillus luteolus]MBE4906512.1 sigma-70 family RNA polymerase sigma factor [Cytobacillus luteolus]MBP1941195.1 RNA polymerase sigma-70 factor (ECF subfamily) [Cytobacillus luteolus]